MNRLAGKYFKPFKNTDDMLPFEKAGYMISIPTVKISATDVRDGIKSGKITLKNISQYMNPNITQQTYDLLKGKLSEGGGYGHMQHIYEDANLTFGDIKKIIDLGLGGKLKSVTEKTDGQNLMITVVNNEVRAARNKSHIKNFAKDSLSIDGLFKMFAGRGDISNAFSFAMNDMAAALNALSKAEKEDIFKNGKRFLSFEVIYPKTTNVIPYGMSMLVFHGIYEYNKDGDRISEVKTGAGKLYKLIQNANAHVQNTFTIKPKADIHLNAIENGQNLKKDLYKQLSAIQGKCGAKDSDKLSKYFEFNWRHYITSLNINDDKVNEILLNRWLYDDKSTSLNDIKKMVDEKQFSDIKATEGAKVKTLNNTFVEPIRNMTMNLGIAILSNMKSVLTVNPSKAIQSLQDEITSTIAAIKASKDDSLINKLDIELTKLRGVGNIVLPTEGIVFTYKGNIYKLTGSFNPINQILGMLKYAR
jgi:hypothetical protein